MRGESRPEERPRSFSKGRRKRGKKSIGCNSRSLRIGEERLRRGKGRLKSCILRSLRDRERLTLLLREGIMRLLD